MSGSLNGKSRVWDAESRRMIGEPLTGHRLGAMCGRECRRKADCIRGERPHNTSMEYREWGENGTVPCWPHRQSAVRDCECRPDSNRNWVERQDDPIMGRGKCRASWATICRSHERCA